MYSHASVQALLQRLLALPENEMDMLLNSTQGDHSTPSIDPTSPRASGANVILGPNQNTPIPLTTDTTNMLASSDLMTNASNTTADAAGTASLIILPPRPDTPTGHVNPYLVGSLKYWGFTLPKITALVLRWFADFHQFFFGSGS